MKFNRMRDSKNVVIKCEKRKKKSFVIGKNNFRVESHFLLVIQC